MTGHTHMAGGFLSANALLYITVPPIQENIRMYETIFVLTATISSLLCDIDEPNSIIGKKLWPLSILLKIVHTIYSLIAFLIPQNTKLYRKVKENVKATGHRGITHWITSSIIISVGVFIIGCMIAEKETKCLILTVSVGILIGMITHILYDAISGKVPLLAPFKTRKYGIKLVETGSFMDRIIIRTICVIAGAYLYYIDI